MPVVYHIDHARRLVNATAHGVFTEADMFTYQQEAWTRPGVGGYDEIVDMTDVTAVEPPPGARMASLAKLAASMDPPESTAKFAIVARTDLHFGLARMYQAVREMNTQSKKTVAVFRTRSEAEQWLGKSARGASAQRPPQAGDHAAP